MGVISSGSGDELLLVRPGCEPATLDEYPDLPIVFTCTIARHEGRVLYVYSAWRHEWEIPAGMVEPGENPVDGAAREVLEESGQIVSALTCLGLCVIRLGRSGRLELGAVYAGELDALHDFQSDGETTNMMLWDGVQPVDGHLDEISLEFCKLVRG